MAKRLRRKCAVLVLAASSVVIFGFGGCLDVTIQRVLAAVAADQLGAVFSG